MSAPQQRGDLIFPWSLGHWETWTVVPSSFVNVSFTKGASQVPQVAFTLIPHESQVYVAMFISNQLVILDFCIFYLKGVFFASNFLQIFAKSDR